MPATDVRVLAGRIDGDGLQWAGRLDRVRRWNDLVEPVSGATVSYYGLSRPWTALLAPIVFSPNRYIANAAWQAYSGWLDRSYGLLGGRALAHYHRGRDVVHRFGGSKLALATVRAAHLSGVPVVISPSAHRGQWDDDDLSALAYREAELIVAESIDARELYLELGVAPERVVFSRHTAAAPPEGSGAGLRRKHGLEGPIVLFVGSSTPYKGSQIVLGAAERLASLSPNARFVFVGGGHESRGLGNVVVAGAVSDEEKAGWFDAADLLVLPSENEAYGLVIDEAWAAGIPVITSMVPELAGRVRAAGAGLAVPREVDSLARAISDLLSNADERAALGAAGKRYWADNLSPEAYAAWFLETYRRVAADGVKR